MAALFLLAQVILFSPRPLAAGGENAWSVFKGAADRNGLSSKASVDLPLKISWTYTLPGKTNGFVDWGPVASSGIIYSGDGLNHVLAMDAKTGGILWTKELISNIFSVSLSEDGKMLYVTVAITTKPTPTLSALNPKTGEILWDNTRDGQPAMGGMEGAPAVADGKIYAGYLQYEGHGGIAAYEGATGKLLWHVQVPRISPYTPVSYAEGRLYVGFENKALFCVDAQTGKNLWMQPLVDLPYAAPTLWEKKVYLGAGNTLYAFDALSGQVIWQKTVEGQIGHSSVSVYEKTLYIGVRESKIFSLTAEEGTLVWTSDLKKGPIESSILIDAKKKLLYVGTEENYFVVLSLKDGVVKSEIRLSEQAGGVWKSAPALYDGRLYVGTLAKTFYALE